MKKFYLVLTFILSPFLLFSQTIAPGIDWQKCLGGTGEDAAQSTLQTIDGGYILAGSAASIDGDVIGLHSPNASDFWIIKLDNDGTVAWKKCFGGGDAEVATSINQTTDEGYIIAGYTKSTDGDVTGLHASAFDFWVLKIDSIGTIQWKKCLGGTEEDQANKIIQTSEGGYLVVGNSSSTDGDVTNNNGNIDFWVVKLNNLGIIQWEKSFGGTSWEVPYTAFQLSNGRYIVAGLTTSIDGDVVGNHGNDGWILNLDTNGTLIWQKCLGGSTTDIINDIQETLDGQIVLAGFSNSIDGDVLGNHGGGDAWIVKVDTVGNIIWQKCVGGTGGEVARSILQTVDGSFIVSGSTNSIDGDVIGNNGNQDAWIFKLDSLGSLIWQKCMGGTNEDWFYSLDKTSDGGYFIAGQTRSNDGDVVGFHGGLGSDTWGVKLLPDSANLFPTTTFVSNVNTICSGAYASFSNQSNLDSAWLWLFPGGNPASSNLQTPPQVYYNTPGTYSVTLISSNAFGSDTLTLTNYITVDPSPTAQINTNLATCEGASINLTSSGGTSYSWVGPNGFTSNLQNPTIANSSVANTGTYSVVVSNSVGCSDTAATQITINTVTPAVANSNSPLCAGQTLNLTSNTASSYSWSGPNGFNSTLQNPSISNLSNNNSGTYTLIVANGNGCTDTTTLSISVLANNPVSINSNGPLCEGQILNLTASAGTSYAWSGPNGFTSMLQNPTINNAVVNNSGSYTVVVTNSNGCTNSASLTVSINPNTPVTASSNSPICEGDNLTMNASTGSSYSWTGPNGFTSSMQNPTISNITTSSSGLYSVTVTNACGTGTSNTQVQVGQKPNAAIAVTQTVICEGDTVYLAANGGSSYYWYGPNGFNSILSTPTVSNFSSANIGEYYLVATNNANCSDTTVVNLTLNESTCFFIPSVFTPNSDGTNDTWVIEGLWQFPNCVVKVYNRWGQSLFESKGYASPWDGTFEGNECPIADYYYIIDLQNESNVFTGTVTIKR
jgi:gliding motility-associated-like protein